ncbi:sporulation integral membrane protein YtvI [Paenisporosarcina quisquiliarum]|uniref:Sporulation integral membrane protein YtvI n=1 Tax=Paenisporosarcina quisquiliarum TaxID=365346 RepID=A0A9X3LED3_9BACL|nr:sporulation integral membrane protein YtvI [Paenisporosarcina quisquiliarum]MCZ8536426.1 sporulation integral membrane protein YtvI [Paenisporosarcina quisquiliarum]
MPKWITKKFLIIALLILLFILFLTFVLPLAIPILLALLTAFLLEPLVKLSKEKFKWNRKTAVITVFILFLLIITATLYLSITQLVGQIIQLTKIAPDYFNTLSLSWMNVQSKLFSFTQGMPIEVVSSIKNELDEFLKFMQEAILGIVSYDSISKLLTGIPNFLVSFIVYIITLFLFMLDLTDLKKMVFRHLTPATAEKVRFMTSRLNSVIFGFVKAQLLASLFILVGSFIGLLFIAPEYAIIMSIVIWIIDIIPILGSIAIVGPWSIYQFIIGDVAMGTKLAILALVLLVIRRAVEPKLMGSQIGLSPLATLIAMFIGLQIFGFLGLIIGPFVVIIFTTAKEAGIIKTNFKL